MIRSIEPEDTPALVALSGRTEMFRPDELGAVQAMLDGYHSSRSDGHQILAWEEQGKLLAIVYFAPREFADRVWELLMIGVDAVHQRRGIGSRVLAAVEDAARRADGRLLLIETSSKPEFERAKRFYSKHGYAQVAHVPDYFADGDGKISFTKRLTPPPAGG